MPHPVGGAMGVTCITAAPRVKPALTSSHLIFIRQLRAGMQSPGCCTLTSTADFAAWQGTQPTVLQLFLRYSVEIYKCANASELIS